MNTDVFIQQTENDPDTLPSVPALVSVSLTNPPSLSAYYKNAHDRLCRYDRVIVGLESGTRTIVTHTLKSMVYFAIKCIEDPAQAKQLEGWCEIDTPNSANPYLHPMKYVTRNASSRSIRTKLTQWAAIAQDVAGQHIPEDEFLLVLKHHGGIDRWYRKLPKDASKGGRQKGYSPKSKGDMGQSRFDNSVSSGGGGHAAPEIRKGLNIADKVLYDSISTRAEAGRVLVCVLFDITESAHFADVNALIGRLQVLSEYVGVVGTANRRIDSVVVTAVAEVVAA